MTAGRRWWWWRWCKDIWNSGKHLILLNEDGTRFRNPNKKVIDREWIYISVKRMSNDWWLLLQLLLFKFHYGGTVNQLGLGWWNIHYYTIRWSPFKFQIQMSSVAPERWPFPYCHNINVDDIHPLSSVVSWKSRLRHNFSLCVRAAQQQAQHHGGSSS